MNTIAKHNFVRISFEQSYQQKMHASTLDADCEQLLVVQQMQRIYDKIEKFHQSSANFNIEQLLPFSLGSTFGFPLAKENKSIKGIYLWGDVGRGKTFLLDLFFECITLKNKLRLHFHRFMQIIHETIDDLGDIEAPLKQTAKLLAKKHKIIYLDEIMVIDIADAMILAELFKHLIANGVILLFTSNTAPENLYKNGLQRARFLPAIDLLSSSTEIIELTGNDDYRLHALEKTDIYQLSSRAETDTNMQKLYHFMTGGIKLHQDRDDLIINYRKIPVKKWESGIVWFSFDMLCNTHRDSSDYIRIATFFSTVMISDIYCLNADQDDIMRRFINMIDVFYDRHINLVVSAQTLPDKLYSGTRLQFEFSRTKSRLIEMQTNMYLSKNKIFKQMPEIDLFDINVPTDDFAPELDNPTRFGDWVSKQGRCSDF